MFEGWSEFYLLVGTAAGALIGLLFVVTTLATGLKMEADALSRGTAFYLTPTLFNYTTVLVMSILATAPHLSGLFVGGVLGLWSLVGLVYSLVAGVMLQRDKLPGAGTGADFYGYGILPAAMYAGLLIGAWAAFVGRDTAPAAIAIGLTVLMVIGIRNSWDLVTFIAPRAKDPSGS